MAFQEHFCSSVAYRAQEHLKMHVAYRALSFVQQRKIQVPQECQQEMDTATGGAFAQDSGSYHLKSLQGDMMLLVFLGVYKKRCLYC